jgi:hypothetical protein
MNVNNFFRFIGDKRPKYKLSAENTDMIDMLKDGYEEDVREYGEDFKDYKELMPMAVEGKGYIDESGNKQGLFLSVHASYEIEKGYSIDDPNEYHFSFNNVYSNYKNNLKDGIESMYAGRKKDVVVYTTEYVGGKKNGKKIKYRMNGDGTILLVTHYVDDRMKQVDHLYDNDKIAYSMYYTTTQSRVNSNKYDTIDENRPTVYYSFDDGKVIDYETYKNQNYFSKVRNIYR